MQLRLLLRLLLLMLLLLLLRQFRHPKLLLLRRLQKRPLKLKRH